ncbi:MAG: hypothetical protein NT121_09175, partial [Chloroflexi bacterium]|nr:hypothetical protein [Chloroflexota bacterium]
AARLAELSGGKSLDQLSRALLDACDPDFIQAEALKAVERYLEGKTPKKVIVVKHAIVSIVI